ncbi:hypothetical protein EXIGLDRAFT_620271 [Exidia glandulosa HHB12029]|uniref:protein-histidine N-methyltransferase n=1 Tax=Exidia glandulosa HHB12029 TaxID=1314781 RepID=A0A165EUM7_EXIGL|nr:hypothetical protein EXIGLDRAFT_620271 [Exidia glandulosa HHB12029]
MFSFDFDVDDAGDVAQTASSDDKQPPTVDSTVLDEVPAQEADLDELFAALPARISYSPLLVRRNDGTELYIARRDLFDARYQLMAGESDEVDAPNIQFLDAPSDLVRGVYEGGLKTWECASDLVQYISEGSLRLLPSARLWLIVAGRQLGCGTAIPSAYALGELFSRPHENASPRAVHVQDYNHLVLELVALPNLLLAWYFSPAAARVRDSLHTSSEAGELDLDGDIVNAFRSDLAACRVDLRLYYGSWRSWQLPRTYDLVLTSETVYEPASLSPLVSLLHASGGRRLVAAKRVYFGVGGGVREFVQEVERAGGTAETVWETSSGVARAILDVRW